MRAVTIQDGQVHYRSDWPEPIPADGEVIVDVLQAGICETDLQLMRGYMDFTGVLGHEFVGVARAGRLAGQRVVGEINCNCRRCARCQAGLGNHCDRRTVLGIDRHDGVFAQRVAIPELNLHAVPPPVSDDQAVLVEPLAAALQITQQVSLQRSDRVAIVGDGRLAYLSAQVICMVTPRLTILGKHAGKMQRFRRLGLECVSAVPDNATESFDVVVDCTGSETGLPVALQLVRPRGTVVMKTTVAAQHQLSLAPLVINEITLVGSRCGPFDCALDALQRERVDVDGLITHRYGLQEIHQALRSAVDSDAFKVVLQMGTNQENGCGA